MTEQTIQEALKPETELELHICSDNSFREGVMWGVPRGGYPEGKILYHIKEVLDNVDKYTVNCSPDVRSDLRLIALLHDTYKYKVDISKQRTGDNHHANIATEHFESIVGPYLNPDHLHKLTTVIAHHDTPVSAYRKGARKNNMYLADLMLDRLMVILFKANALPLFTLFYACDAHTGNKDQKDFEYFSKYVKEKSGNG